jgi:hypothetical protein
VVKLIEPVGQGAATVTQQVFPFGPPPAQIHLFIDALDDIIFGREVSEKQRLGNAEASGKLSSLATKANFSKIPYCLINYLLLTFIAA